MESNLGLTKPPKVGFIGGGQMATALAKGFISSGLVKASDIIVSAPSDRNLVNWREMQCKTTHDNVEIILEADIVFFAVKPHLFPVVMRNLREACKTPET